MTRHGTATRDSQTHGVLRADGSTETHEGSHDVEDDEGAPDARRRRDLAVPDRRHGDEQPVHALPVAERVRRGGARRSVRLVVLDLQIEEHARDAPSRSLLFG